MVAGVIIGLAVGALLIVMGTLIWKKQKVSLLHDYHYKNVKKEDLPAYTRLVGIGIITIGTGICIMGILNLILSPLWWIPLLAGFVSGFIVLFRAQMKYNGSVLG